MNISYPFILLIREKEKGTSCPKVASSSIYRPVIFDSMFRPILTPLVQCPTTSSHKLYNLWYILIFLSNETIIAFK